MNADEDSSVRVFGSDGSDEYDEKVWKQLQRDDEKAVETQQVDPDDNRSISWYRPPYPPGQMITLLEKSETHAVCVRAKKKGVAGHGFNLVPHADVDASDDPPGRDTLIEFWRRGKFTLGPNSIPATASDVLENVWNDYEGIGWGVAEILVNSSTGIPTGLSHIPAQHIRKRSDGPGYVQLKDGTPAKFFGQAGDRYGDDQRFINSKTGAAGSTTGEVDGQVANELIVICNYSALAPHYGISDVVPAIPTIAGDVAARKYNLNFFDNDGVPRFAVIVEGGELSDRAWTNLEKKFKKLKQEGESHRGILIEASEAVDSVDTSGVNIRLEPLTVGIDEDASFIEYRQENEHDILKVHEVPPIIANRTENTNYSNGNEQRQEFAQDTIRPRQTKLANRLYQILHVSAFEIPEWTIEFNLHGGQNRQREADIAQTRIEASMGAITVNEAREELGYDPLTDDDGNELPQGQMLLASLQGSGSTGPLTARDLDSAVERARSDERARTAGYSITARRGQKGENDGDEE